MELFNLTGRILLDGVDRINSQISGISDRIEALGHRMTNVGNNIANFGRSMVNNVSEPLIKLTAAGVKYNATVELLQSGFDVLLGSQSKAASLMQDIKVMAAKTPFDIPGLADATKTMLTFGISQEKVLPLISRIGDLALGDSTSFKVLSFNIGQAANAGRLMTGDFNSLVKRGFSPFQYITKKTGETMVEFKDRMKDGKVSYKELEEAIVDATSEGGRFYKGMEKGAVTLSGKISTLKDTFNELLGTATKPLFYFIRDVAVPNLIKLGEKLTKLNPVVLLIATAFTALGIIIPPLIVAFGTMIAITGFAISSIAGLVGSIGIVGLAIGGVITAISGFGIALGAIVLTSDNVRASIKNHFNSLVEHIKQAASWVKLHANDIKQAISGLIIGLRTDDFTKFGEAMAQMFPNNVVAIGNWINKFREFKVEVVELRTKLFEFASNLKQSLIETKNSEQFKGMIESFRNVKNAVVELVDNFKRLRDALNEMGNGGDKKSAVAGASGGLAAGNKMNTLSSMAQAIRENIDVINTVIGKISDFIRFLAQLQEGANKTSRDIRNFESSVKQAFSNIYTSVSGTVSYVVNTVIDRFNLMRGVASNAVEGLRGNIVGIFNGIYNSVTGIIGGLVNSVASRFNSIVSTVHWVAGAFNSLSSAIGGVINKISQIKFPSPPSWLKGLPGFADGVRNFAGGLAVVGERGAELVSLPKGSNVYSHQESRQMLRGTRQNVRDDSTSKSGTIVVNVNYPQISNKYDINKIGADIVAALRRQGIRTI